MVERLYEKIDGAGKTLKRKRIEEDGARFVEKGGQRWLPVVEQAAPLFTPERERLETSRTVLPDRVEYSFTVLPLTTQEAREQLDPLRDLIEVLVSKGLFNLSELNSTYGD